MLVLAQRNKVIKRNATNVTYEGKTLVADFLDGYGKIDAGTYIGKRNNLRFNAGGPNDAKPPALLLMGSESAGEPTLGVIGKTGVFTWTKFLASFNNSITPEIAAVPTGTIYGTTSFSTGLFGKNAVNLTGAASLVRYSATGAGNIDFLFNADYTIRFWIKATSVAGGNPYLFDFGNNSGVLKYVSGAFTMFYAGSSQIFSIASAFPLNVWNHVAITRVNNVTRFFFNGNVLTTVGTAGAVPTAFGATNAALTINSWGASGATGGYAFTGTTSYQDFEVDNRIGLYTANFTPPTVPAGPVGA